MTHPAPRGWLIDLDGTLIRSEGLYASALREYKAQYGGMTGENLVGYTTMQNIAYWAQLNGWDADIEHHQTQYMQFLHDYIPRNLECFTFQPDAGAFLTWLAEQNVPRAIVTSAHRPFVERIDAKLGLFDFFRGQECLPEQIIAPKKEERGYGGCKALDAATSGEYQPQSIRGQGIALVAYEDVPTGCTKPEPDPYLRGADRLGLLPEECIAVEDSEPGVASARAAGMRVIYVRRDRDARVPDGSDITVESLSDIPGLMKNI